VAARQAGLRLEGADLLERAARSAGRGDADVLVTALSGGLLAALTPRYSVRDLAREIGAPLAVAVRAAPDVSNLARLTLEAAWGGGLRAVAVVLTGWPDRPDGALLDERDALGELVEVPVQVLAEEARAPDELRAAAEGWGVEAWLEPPPADEAGAGPAPVEVTLEPYESWAERTVGDPRATPRPAIMASLLEIVAAEGPMTASRAYALYNRASGGRKLTAVARAPLSSALHWLAQERRIVLTRESDIPWQGDDVVRAPDAPTVRVRALGPRALDEVPLDEVAELVSRLRATRGLHEPSDLKRAVLGTYGLVRLTARADEYLTLAIDLAHG
jgi:hypothetical protein